MSFDTHINGIPCQCRVTEYWAYIPPRITGYGYGDTTPPEEELFDFELLDRKGYRAHWLDRYITPAVEARLLREYRQHRAYAFTPEPDSLLA